MSCPSQVLGVYGVLHLKMDLQKLRPTYSQWRAPLDTAVERRAATIQKPQAQTAAKQLAQPPKGKGNELWQRFYNDAVAQGHPMPDKLADTLLRSRERTLELAAKRHTTKEYTGTPKMQETVAVAGKAASKGRKVIHESLRCKAKTLAGKQCPFKATCSGFCNKHQVADAPFAIPAK